MLIALREYDAKKSVVANVIAPTNSAVAAGGGATNNSACSTKLQAGTAAVG